MLSLYYLSPVLLAIPVYFYIKRKQIKKYIINRITKQIFKLSMSRPASFLEGRGNYAIIRYERMGLPYRLFIPYHKREVLNQIKYRVFLEQGKQLHDITQQPGMEYLLTARQLGGDGIIIINIETNEQFRLGPDDKIDLSSLSTK